MPNDIRIEFKGNIDDFLQDCDSAINNWLEESAGELESQVKENSNVQTGQTKGSYSHIVDEGKKQAHVGSPLPNAIWEEYGTGEYALNGNGRKGWWVYVKGGDDSYKSDTPKKYYTKQQAIKVMMALRAKGLDAHITRGKHPNRPLFRAFNENEQKIINRLEKVLSDVEVKHEH